MTSKRTMAHFRNCKVAKPNVVSRIVGAIVVLLIQPFVWSQRPVDARQSVQLPEELAVPGNPGPAAFDELKWSAGAIFVMPGTNPRVTTQSNRGFHLAGVNLILPEAATSNGAWLQKADGLWVWRFLIQSKGASGLRLNFTKLDGNFGNLWVRAYASAGKQWLPVPSSDVGSGTEFWSGIAFGDSIELLYEAPLGIGPDSLPFRIDRVSHLWELDIPSARPRSVGLQCFLDVSGVNEIHRVVFIQGLSAQIITEC
jgi:hypothetical protein